MASRSKGQTAVFGIFESRLALENAIDNLRMAGFRRSDMSILAPDIDSDPKFAHEKATKAPEVALQGAVVGLAVGAALGWMLGTGRMVIGDLSLLAVAGPWVSAFAGVGLFGTLFAIIGAFLGMNIPEYEAKRYETRVERGGLLMSVHADDTIWESKARGILRCCGAKDVASQPEIRTDAFTADYVEEQEYGEFNVL